MKKRPSMVRETAAAGGVGVILMTGYAAVTTLPRGTNLELAIVICLAMLTLTASIALWRYVVRHKDEIGEARFDTTKPRRD